MEENVMEMSVKAQPDTAAVADEELVSSDMQTAQRAYNISAGLRQALNKELRRPGKSMLLCLCRCVLDIVGNYYRLYLLMYSWVGEETDLWCTDYDALFALLRCVPVSARAPAVDFVVDAARKLKKTPLVDALLRFRNDPSA